MSDRVVVVTRPPARVVATSRPPARVSLAELGAPGPAGPPGDTGYTHVQGSAAATWTVNHGLGRRPTVAVLTTGGIEVEAAVLHVSDDQLVVSLNSPLAGSAVCT